MVSAIENLALKKLEDSFVASNCVALIAADQLKPEPIRWMWPGWLARGKLHVLAGAPGTGKTTIAMDIAACVSSGRAFPSGFRAKQGHVLVWSGEDDPKDTLVPRLIAAGADLSRVKFVGDVQENGKTYLFDPSRDVDKLSAAAALLGDIALIVVDPLVSAVAGDSHKNAEVRRGLAPLVELAVQLDAALLGITHFFEGTQGRDPLERVSGSLAFGALARVVFGTVRQDAGEDGERRMMLARAKSNIGPDGGGSHTFEQTTLHDHNGIEASRITWGLAVDGSARDLLAESESDDDAGEDAASFLTDLLGRSSLPSKKEVFKEASAAGYSQSSMQRAKRKIGAIAEKSGNAGPWVWRMRHGEGDVEDSEDDALFCPSPSSPSKAKPSPSPGTEAFEV